MAKSPVAAEIHQPFDIHGNLGTELTFHLELAVNYLTDIVNLGLRQIIGLGVRVNFQLPEDTLLLITAGKLESTARKSKWVQALDRAGVVVFVWPLNAREFNGWVQQRMRQRGLDATPEAVALLADRVEGNLLACMQEIDKLYLLQDGGVVDADAIMSLVGDNARYDVYGLVDSALSGDGSRSVRILQGLCAEGLAPQVVVWALARELRQLAAMQALVEGG